MTLYVTIAIVWAARTLNFSFKYLRFKNDQVKLYFLSSNFDKQDKMQLLAKKFCSWGSDQSHVKFSKIIKGITCIILYRIILYV